MQIGSTAYGCVVEGGDHNIGPHDTSYNAACFTTFASQFQQLDSSQYLIMSFTGFSDLWDQQGVFSAPFHNGYGWLTNRGIKKPIYHALRLLYQYATDRDYHTVTRENSNEDNTTLEVFVTINSKKDQLSVFIMNWLPIKSTVTLQTETVIVNLNNISSNNKLPTTAIVYRIDDDNCNPNVVWQNMGSPIYPTQDQINDMVNASNTFPQTLDLETNGQDITMKLDIPVYGMAVVVIDL